MNPHVPDKDLPAWVDGFRRRHGLEDFPVAADTDLAEQRAAQARDYFASHVDELFAEAVPTRPEVQRWAASVLRTSVERSMDRGRVANVHTGRSLLLLGGTGAGKTHEAFGAMRVLAACGLHSRWVLVSAPDLYAQLRPRHGIDSEEVFEKFADAPILIVDDLAAGNISPFVEEVNYRVVDRRSRRTKPSIFTSNVPAKDIPERDGRPGRPGLETLLDDRVASRLAAMCDQVPMKGPDNRRRTA